MLKVLLETEECEWQNSGEGKEMPKKVIQVSLTKLFPHNAPKAINSGLKIKVEIWREGNILF